jgi:hypothetical protein
MAHFFALQYAYLHSRGEEKEKFKAQIARNISTIPLPKLLGIFMCSMLSN